MSKSVIDINPTDFGLDWLGLKLNKRDASLVISNHPPKLSLSSFQTVTSKTSGPMLIAAGYTCKVSYGFVTIYVCLDFMRENLQFISYGEEHDHFEFSWDIMVLYSSMQVHVVRDEVEWESQHETA